jgi:hypothetical protein
LRKFAGLPFRTIYSLGSLVAAVTVVVALAVAVRPAKAGG